MGGRGMWPDDKGGPEREHPEPEDKDKKREEVEAQRRLDENSTILTDHFPLIWRALYVKSMEAGFTEEQAFSIVKCYILKDALNGVHIHKD